MVICLGRRLCMSWAAPGLRVSGARPLTGRRDQQRCGQGSPQLAPRVTPALSREGALPTHLPLPPQRTAPLPALLRAVRGQAWGSCQSTSPLGETEAKRTTEIPGVGWGNQEPRVLLVWGGFSSSPSAPPQGASYFAHSVPFSFRAVKRAFWKQGARGASSAPQQALRLRGHRPEGARPARRGR